MNLSVLLDMAADGFGERTVLGSRRGGITAGRLQELSFGGAAVLRERDADALVYLAVNGPAFPVALFAAARAGVPLVPLNYRLGEEQLLGLLARHPRALVVADPRQCPAVTASGLPSLAVEDWLAAAAAAAATSLDGDEPDDDAPAVVIYTSGTTSTPKGVLLQHEHLTSYVIGSVEFASAEADHASLVSVPPYHIAAVANTISNLYAGRRSIVLDAFTPEQWLQVVREERVSHALVIPTMLARIMQTGPDASDAPNLRSLAYGGARMPAKVITAALRAWPHVDFVNAYGLTETSSTVAVLGPEEHRVALSSDDPAVAARLASAGRPVPGIELEVRRADDTPAARGEVGRVWLRGAQISGRYAGAASAIDDRGFFDTRDQGYLDAEGYLFICGRADDTIIRGGENVAPAEIEDVLLRHEDVADAVVVGVPDEEWGQRIEAVVVPRDGVQADAEELRRFVRAALRGSKTPDRITTWDELPRTETGKLIRRAVVEKLTRPVPAGAP